MVCRICVFAGLFSLAIEPVDVQKKRALNHGRVYEFVRLFRSVANRCDRTRNK